MADLARTIEIIFGATDNLSPALTSIGEKLGDFDTGIQSVAQPLADFAEKLLAGEAAATALAAAFVGLSLDRAAEFRANIEEIGSLTGKSSEDVGKLSDSILEYATSSEAGLGDITAAMYSATSAGAQYADNVEFIKQAEQLAGAGRAGLADTTDLLTGSLNAYGASVGEAGRFTDILFTAVQNGKLKLDDLNEGLGKVSAIAAGAGIPFEELAASVAALTTAGVGPAEAISSIRAAISSIIAPSKEAQKEADALGIGFNETALKTKGFQGVLADVIEATGGSTEKIQTLFGKVEALPAVLNLGKDAGGAFANTLKAMEEAGGAAARGFAQVNDDFGFDLGELANHIEISLVKAGLPMLESFGAGVSGIQAVVDQVGNAFSGGAFAPVIGAINALAEQSGVAFQAIAEAFPEAVANLDFSRLISSIDALGGEAQEAFSNLFTGLDLTTPEGLQTALQRIVDGFAALTRVSAGVIDGLQPVFASIGEGARRFADSDQATQDFISKILTAAESIATFGTGLGSFILLLGQTRTNISAVGDIIQGAWLIAVNLARLAFDDLGLVVNTVLEGIALNLDLLVPDALEEKLGLPFAKMREELGKSREGLLALRETDLKALDNNLALTVDGFGRLGEGSKTAADKATDSSERIGAAQGAAAEKAGAFKDALHEGWLTTEQATARWNDYTEALENTAFPAAEQGDLNEQLEISLGTYDDINRILGEGRDARIAEAEATITQAEKARGYHVVLNELGEAVIHVGNAHEETAKKTEDNAKAAERAKEKAQDYQLKLEEIASNERIKNIEAAVTLNVADLEAQTERVKAAFASIDNTVNSTGDLLGQLFGSLSNADEFTQLIIRDQIAEENRRRDEALKLQKELTEAQINNLKAKTERIQRGEALIKIEAPGLEQPLEQIWRTIVRNIQVKANEQGEELFLNAIE